MLYTCCFHQRSSEASEECVGRVLHAYHLSSSSVAVALCLTPGPSTDRRGSLVVVYHGECEGRLRLSCLFS